MNWKMIAVSLIGVIALGGLLNWQVSENKKLVAENASLVKENKSINDDLQDYEQRINTLHELDTKHTTELTNAKAEIDQLRIAAERNPERVYIRASCPKGESNTTSGLDDGTTARPTDSAIRNYWLLRNRIAELTRMVLGLQDYIKAQCVQ